jgi:Helix-turn-helix domain
MNPETLESFVDADAAAKFLSLTRRRVLDLARAGKFPGHPIGDGSRRVWRFRLSELAAAIAPRQNSGFISQERARMVRRQPETSRVTN